MARRAPPPAAWTPICGQARPVCARCMSVDRRHPWRPLVAARSARRARLPAGRRCSRLRPALGRCAGSHRSSHPRKPRAPRGRACRARDLVCRQSARGRPPPRYRQCPSPRPWRRPSSLCSPRCSPHYRCAIARPPRLCLPPFYLPSRRRPCHLSLHRPLRAAWGCTTAGACRCALRHAPCSPRRGRPWRVPACPQ